MGRTAHPLLFGFQRSANKAEEHQQKCLAHEKTQEERLGYFPRLLIPLGPEDIKRKWHCTYPFS